MLTASTRATTDNWTYGVYNQYNGKYGTVPGADKVAMRLTSPLNPGKVTTHSAEKAYEKVLEYCGASLTKDSVDIRILKDVSTGTATYMNGGNGSTKGIVDTQGAVGGWPVLESLNAPTDSDDDGMPDNWETANSLNPYSGDDAQLKSVDGVYPNIEVYINSLVTEIVTEQNKEGVITASNKIRLSPFSDAENLKIWFNQAEKSLVVSHTENITGVRIYSITGQLMLNQEYNQSDLKIETQGFKQGIYIVTVKNSKNKLYSKKFVLF